jgi:hypothetical protein
MAKFQAGKSGNPGGRPRGSLNKTTLATQALLDGEAEILTRKVVEMAKAGNPVALRLCLERLLPPRKDRPINLTLPKVEGAKDLPKALWAVVEAVAQGEITPEEGQALKTMLEAYRKVLETADLEARLSALEKSTLHGKS